MLAFAEFERLRVVLVAARNPLNIGAAARAMSNFGFARLRVVNPYGEPFREARSAVGAAAVLENAEEYQSVADAVADCTLVVGATAARHRELQHALRSVQDAAPLLRSNLRSGAVALLFGSEKRGLSNEELSHCHWLLRIPTCEERTSMNLGQAVAICLYELVREGAAPAEAPRSASAVELERMTALLMEALRAGGYAGAESALGEQKVRRMIRRLSVPAGDADTWLGMLRQIVWKLGRDSNPNKT